VTRRILLRDEHIMSVLADDGHPQPADPARGVLRGDRRFGVPRVAHLEPWTVGFAGTSGV
jgi:hypothetical protein